MGEPGEILPLDDLERLLSGLVDGIIVAGHESGRPAAAVWINVEAADPRAAVRAGMDLIQERLRVTPWVNRSQRVGMREQILRGGQGGGAADRVPRVPVAPSLTGGALVAPAHEE
jgi:DNA-binding transcriptional LysR family regulator